MTARTPEKDFFRTIAPKPQGRALGTAGKAAAHMDFPIKRVECEPDITLRELADAVSEARVPWRAPAALVAFGIAKPLRLGIRQRVHVRRTYTSGITRRHWRHVRPHP